jgi:hypothetical protein
MLFPSRIALLSVSFFMFSGGALGCRAQGPAISRIQRPAPANEKEQAKPGELKVLAEGYHSAITDSFVAVVRDAATYAALVKLDGNLPNLDEEFFKSNAVIAAFLGQRNTGGYSVDLVREGPGGFRVVEKKPGKGMMVSQVITSPFKLVSLSLGVASPIGLVLDGAWNRQQKYHVTNGIFIMSGGISGRSERFGLEGQVLVMREGRLATFNFLLKNAVETNEHVLVEFATGIVDDNGAITVPKLSALSLVSPPNSGLQARGRFLDNDSRLLFGLTSLPSMIADGYSGAGSIEALIVGSTPKP